MTDQVVDWAVCWQLREGRQQLMRFNWSVSCQLSLVPHLTLSDAVSLLHQQEHEAHACVCAREREWKGETLDICMWSVSETMMYV